MQQQLTTTSFNDLIQSLDNFFSNGGDNFEIRGGKGNQKIACVRPRSSADSENPNQKYDLEILDANGESQFILPLTADFDYIIPTVMNKPLKARFGPGDY